ncbi:MAG: hypothetical protein FWG34_08025 [Oscillospiraceae bacterium]|nr:hypothetical protein [Oscillospiraceae bacterium]
MKTSKKIMAAALVLSVCMGLCAMPAGSQKEGQDFAPDDLAVVAGKDEVVYARLSAGGEAVGIYVVNHFKLDGGGAFSDFGNYSDVVNLTDLNPLEMGGGKVSAVSGSENFFYQGNLADNELPWFYRIEYTLDGENVSPGNLAGKSGKLGIRIISGKNSAAGDAFDVFTENYMQQITVSLDIYKCQNIEENGATIATAGKNRMLVFTVMPGEDADIAIGADVADFEMAGIEITAMPFSMNFEIPGADDMLGDFAKLSDGIAMLDSGAGELESGAAELGDGAKKLKSGSSDIRSALSELLEGVGKLASGAGELSGGAAELISGSSDFSGGLLQLDKNSAKLTDGSAQIQAALSQIADGLQNSAQFSANGLLDDLAKLPDGLNRLSDGLVQVSDGMDRFKEAYSKAYAALDNAIAAIPEPQLKEEQMFGLFVKATDGEQALLGYLLECYAAAMTVRGTYEAVKPAFESVGVTMDTLSDSVYTIAAALSEIAGQIGEAAEGGESMEKMRQLTEGISQIYENYMDFHIGLVAYARAIGDLAKGYGALDSGIADFGGGVSELCLGMAELNSGAKDFAGGYGEFDAGVGDLSDGMEKFYDGITKFCDGTGEMAKETADMPQTVRDKIDSMLERYTGKYFEAVSFASSENKNISFVQFVFMTDKIEKPKTEAAKKDQSAQPGFWERLFGLFGG